jgi:tetratricopeptide (TPR) repeat protein
MKDDYKSEKVMSDDDLQQKIEQLFSQAEESKKQDDLDGAEKKYIEIIGFDSKNIRAFKELGELYYERKDYEDAKQTFEHILKLGGTSHEAAEPSFKASPAETKSAVNPELISKQQAQIYADLALVNQALENFVAATASLKKALEIEPNNPRFLDSLLEISIMNKDKVLSLDCYKKLSQVNPDNQKLSDFKAQIDEL